MNKYILETILKKNLSESCLEKVVSVESVPAVGKNLNFLSSVDRFNLKVVLGNGRLVKRSLIAKFGSGVSPHLGDFNERYSTFKTEISMYHTLRELEYLMEELEDTEDILWCKMAHYIPYDCIVMEDLKAQGFDTVERHRFYDLDHILLSAHSLGRYHGMCKALEGRGLAPEGLKTWFVFDNIGMQEFFYYDIIGLVEGIKRLWDPSWRPIVEKVNITKEEIKERLKKLGQVDETKFNVTNHGDCHKNNIVVKYNWEKRPISMRFLDFQLAHYGSPCIDLTYMLYLAVNPCVRRDNFDLILRTYHSALLNTLDKYNFEGKKPDMQEIIDGMERYFFLAMMLVLSWYPKLLRSDKMDEFGDMKKVVETEGKEGYFDEHFNPELLEKDLGPDIKDFIKRFCSDSYV